MKRLSIWRLAVLGVLVVAVVASSALASDGSSSSVASRPLAVWQAGFTFTLGRVDPATLLRVGKQVGVPLGSDIRPVLSPRGRWVALSGDSVAAVSVASAVPLRQPGHPILLPRGAGHVLALGWPRAHRLLALAGREPLGPSSCLCRTLRVYVVDPLKRRILRSIRLPRAFVMAAEPTPTGLAILLGGYGKLASARLLLVSRSGTVRSVTLARFKVGFTKLGKDGVRVTQAALTVGDGSAYVLGRGGATTAVAVVPLAHGPAAYHALPAGPELIRPDRGLVLLAGGRLGAASVTGLFVYDTHSWQQVGSVPFDGQTGFISRDTMIVSNGGSGVDVYNLDGSLRYHLDTPAQVNGVLFLGGRGFLIYQQTYEGWGVLDLEGGTLHQIVAGSVPQLIPGQPGVPASASTPF
jgi:hypothetical protein